MLIGRSPQVLAYVNAHAVLGALPQLCVAAPRARERVANIRPTLLSLSVRGGPHVGYLCGTGQITPAPPRRFSSGPTLAFASCGHFNAVMAGSSVPPIPVAGVSGLKFLQSKFTPLTEVLRDYLESDEEKSTAATLLRLEVAARAIAIVGNMDRSGQVSAAHMADGAVDIEVGDDHRFRIDVQDHQLRYVDDPVGRPRAALRFADADITREVLDGGTSAMDALADQRIEIRGFIPLVDNVNRILARVEAYLKPGTERR